MEAWTEIANTNIADVAEAKAGVLVVVKKMEVEEAKRKRRESDRLGDP